MPEDGNAADRHGLFTSLLQRYVSKEGLVDYHGIGNDPAFARYLNLLNKTDPDTIRSRDDQFAFWLNVYNAYTIKLIVDRMPLSSIRDIGLGLPIISGPWSIDIAAVGGEVYTLNAVEHDILRERFKDSRLHFALVCAARGCPKLRQGAYEGDRVNSQLDEETRRFVNDPDRNRFDTASRTAYLSRILDWYEGDFGEGERAVLGFLAGYVEREAVRAMLLSGDCEVEYLEYDWSLNGQ
jgi:hypothetical protein